MTDFLPRVQVNWHKTLDRILTLAAKAKRTGLLVFDLDSTVFDNRPRQARIVREFGKATGRGALEGCQAWHFTSGWDLRGAVTSCGFSQQEADAMYPELKSFWQARFFTSKYCVDDVEIVGAPRYLHALDRSKARVIYVTGRHEGMRKGTEACLERCGMPMPSTGGHVRLLMKPKLQDNDDAFKTKTHDDLRAMGTVLAAFDNEPTHINDYAVKFGRAIPVHLATDHSGRDVPLNERCVSIPHFAY
ncbi:MAG: hypothetical protein U0228_20115 [Myxococcaceae bacterium]